MKKVIVLLLVQLFLFSFGETPSAEQEFQGHATSGYLRYAIGQSRIRYIRL